MNFFFLFFLFSLLKPNWKSALIFFSQQNLFKFFLLKIILSWRRAFEDFFFLEKGLRNLFFPGEGPLKFSISWRRAFEISFLHFPRLKEPTSQNAPPGYDTTVADPCPRLLQITCWDIRTEKFSSPLQVNDQHFWVSPHRNIFLCTLVPFTSRTIPRIVLI